MFRKNTNEGKKTQGPQENMILSPTRSHETVAVTTHEGNQQSAVVMATKEGSEVATNPVVKYFQQQVEELQVGGDQKGVSWHEAAKTAENIFKPTHESFPHERSKQTGGVATNGVEQVLKVHKGLLIFQNHT